jgi:hypothetical protein
MTRSDADALIGDRQAAAALLERLVAMMDHDEVSRASGWCDRCASPVRLNNDTTLSL